MRKNNRCGECGKRILRKYSGGGDYMAYCSRRCSNRAQRRDRLTYSIQGNGARPYGSGAQGRGEAVSALAGLEAT